MSYPNIQSSVTENKNKKEVKCIIPNIDPTVKSKSEIVSKKDVNQGEIHSEKPQLSVIENNENEANRIKGIIDNDDQGDLKNVSRGADIANVSDKVSDFENSYSQKRTNDTNDRPFVKRKKNKTEPFYQQHKNALMQLNELKPGLKYKLESENGPSHDPVFVFSVEVNDEKFIGKGHSKQLAKHAAAESALKSFIQFHDMSDAFRSLSREVVHVDFTDDNLEVNDRVFNQNICCKSASGIDASDASLLLENRINNKLRKLITQANKKGPVSLLNELWPGLTYTLVKENPANTDQRFIMNVIMGGKKFEGAGQNKRMAKAAVARAILSQQYQVNFNSSLCQVNESDLENFDFPQTLADKIGKLVHDTIDKISININECPKWKVLAGIVMTKDEAMEDMEVVCVATGTKNLKGENTSLTGAVLNDCHAEILARRCLKDFLFTQLELHANGEGYNSIFERINDKFKLKLNYKFHFYNSVAPCGDAATFSVHEGNIRPSDIEQEVHGSGMLRTKLESGNGTIPIESFKDDQKTFDITVQQAGHQTMSCSDKITVWNILGIQGSLLNYFIEPIYLHSIILGRNFQHNHMIYSMFKRIENSLNELPHSFSLHKPKIACTSTLATRQLLQPPKISINWTCGLENPELVVADTGKPLVEPVSRLAKRSFFQRFIHLYNVFLKMPISSQSCFYRTVKTASPNHQQAKLVVMKAFITNELGIWKKKPEEQELFVLPI